MQPEAASCFGTSGFGNWQCQSRPKDATIHARYSNKLTTAPEAFVRLSSRCCPGHTAHTTSPRMRLYHARTAPPCSRSQPCSPPVAEYPACPPDEASLFAPSLLLLLSSPSPSSLCAPWPQALLFRRNICESPQHLTSLNLVGLSYRHFPAHVSSTVTQRHALNAGLGLAIFSGPPVGDGTLHPHLSRTCEQF